MYISRGYRPGNGAGPSSAQKAKSRGWMLWLSRNLNPYRRTCAWAFSSEISKGGFRSITTGSWATPRMRMENSEALVRRLIERITVFDEMLVIEFKSGLEVEVEV